MKKGRKPKIAKPTRGEESGHNSTLEQESRTAEEVEILPPENAPSSLVRAEQTSVAENFSEAQALEAETKDLVVYDSLQAYLREIQQYPTLTREEERAVALHYQESKDLQAAYKLVTSNLRLVVMIAREYQRAARNILDLVQEGNIGLMEAVKNFDPYKEVRFSSYAVWWIRAYIIRYVIANWRLVKIGTTQAQRKLFFNLQKEKEKLEREGFSPAPKLLAQRLQVKESEVVEMQQRLGSPDMSIDAPLNPDDSESNLHTVLAYDGLSAEELLSRQQLRTFIEASFEEFRHTLDAKERAIFAERLLGEDKATLQDLAEKFDVSRERIRQIENRVKEKLKVYMQGKLDLATLKSELDL